MVECRKYTIGHEIKVLIFSKNKSTPARMHGSKSSFLFKTYHYNYYPKNYLQQFFKKLFHYNFLYNIVFQFKVFDNTKLNTIYFSSKIIKIIKFKIFEHEHLYN